MFWSTLIALPHTFMFKYQVDNNKYVKFFIPIHQPNLFNIGLPVSRVRAFLKLFVLSQIA